MRLEDDDVDTFVLSRMKADVTSVPSDSQGIRLYWASEKVLTNQDIDRFIAARVAHSFAIDGKEESFNLIEYYREAFTSFYNEQRRSIEKNIELLWDEAQKLVYTNDFDAWDRFRMGESEFDSQGRFMGRCGEGEPSEEDIELALNSPRILNTEPGTVEATDPSQAHYSAARRALEEERFDLSTAEESGALDRLARELFKANVSLFANVGLQDGASYPRETEDPSEDGMLYLDARLARYLEALGGSGREAAQILRARATRRLEAWRSRRTTATTPEDARVDILFRLWLSPAGSYFEEGEKADFSADSSRTPYLVLLARVLWRDRLAPAIECEQAPQARVPRVMVGGDEYAKLPRSTSGASWAFGGTGEVVKIDGDDYAEAPALVSRWVPKTVAIIREEDHKLAHQLSLSIDREELPLVVAATSSAGYVLPPIAGKLLVWMMATSSDAFVKTDLGTLARTLDPKADSVRSRDIERLAEGLRCLEALRLVLPDATSVRILDIRRPDDPAKAAAEQTVGWAFGPAFADAVLNRSEDPRLRKLHGWLLLNLSGAMRLPLTRPTLLRHYVRAGALWNDSRDPKTQCFERAFLRAYTPEEWGVLTNSMTQGTIDYLQSKDARLRRKMSEDVRRTEKDLQDLEGLGLIRLEKSGRKELLILPPAPLLEAYRAHRRGARRLHA